MNIDEFRILSRRATTAYKVLPIVTPQYVESDGVITPINEQLWH